MFVVRMFGLDQRVMLGGLRVHHHRTVFALSYVAPALRTAAII